MVKHDKVGFRVDKDELHRIACAARSNGLSIAEYLRQCEHVFSHIDKLVVKLEGICI